MKRYKFSMDIHTKGHFNEAVFMMIQNNNSGEIELDFDTIRGHVKSCFARYPTITPVTIIQTNTNGIMNIIEGDKHTLTVTMKELYELETPPTVFTHLTK